MGAMQTKYWLRAGPAHENKLKLNSVFNAGIIREEMARTDWPGQIPGGVVYRKVRLPDENLAGLS
ncbi:MAG TPA: hypothetical protein VG077_10700 [Verrucomicrobiae bacterium]|nr:hypothetical protein [Verrucomicrobiae bacterium]